MIPKGAADLARDVPDSCDRLAGPVPLPTISDTDDVRLSEYRHRGALIEANARLEESTDCNAGLRRRLAQEQK